MLRTPSLFSSRRSAAIDIPAEVSVEQALTPTNIAASETSRTRVRAHASGERVLLLLLVVIFVVKGLIPAWRHLNSDFPNYYLVARLYRAGYPLERVYDWTWLQRQKDYAGIDQGLVSFIPSTLPSALAVAPWSSLPPLEAKHRWLIANLIFLLLTELLLVRLTKLPWERAAVMIFLAFVPLRNNFLFGQMHLLVLLLLALAAWLFFGNLRFLSGISLAIAAALKIYPALFLFYFAWKKQWRAAAGLLAGLVVVALGSLYLFGHDACLLYVRRVLPAGLRGETLDPYNSAWNSWTALLRRLFIAEPELNPLPVAHLPWLYACLHPLIHGSIFVAFMWAIGSRKRDAERTKIEWAAFVFLLLFLSSQPGSYHFVALILTATLVIDYLVAQKRSIASVLVVVTYALICAPIIRLPWATPTGWQNLLFFSRLAFMTVLGVMVLWVLVSSSGQSHATHSPRNTAVAIVALVVLWTAGFLLAQRHLNRQFDNYRSRVATAAGNLLALDPAFVSDALLFTSMKTGRYSIQRFSTANSAEFLGEEGDWFHPTYSGTVNSLWVEQPGAKSSRIVQFTLDPSGRTFETKTEIENAQQPVVSRDGHMLAFLRAAQGRNSLWTTKGLVVRREGSAPEKEIAGAEYDVWEAVLFPDGQVVFSSKRSGGFALYRATQTGDLEKLTKPSCAARYPAVSPDGKRLAFACEQGTGTQIHVADLDGSKDMQLTAGDCNSTSPAWAADSRSLVYVTDCGRGLGLTALVRVNVSP